jgi:hypothetical protein
LLLNYKEIYMSDLSKLAEKIDMQKIKQNVKSAVGKFGEELQKFAESGSAEEKPQTPPSEASAVPKDPATSAPAAEEPKAPPAPEASKEPVAETPKEPVAEAPKEEAGESK